MAYHLTQGDAGQLAAEALRRGDLKAFERPVQLVFGKSLVGSSRTGDVMEGITGKPIAFVPVSGYRPVAKKGVSIELGGPWSFYREFWKAHDLGHLEGLLKQPEVSIAAGERLHLPITISNATDAAQDVTLKLSLPDGWREENGTAVYPVEAHGTYQVQAVIQSPAQAPRGWVQRDIVASAQAQGKGAGSIHVRVMIGGGGLPQ